MKILLCGKMGAGKDTVADYLRYSGQGFFKFAFADGVKLVAKQLFPREYKASQKPRKLLQQVGQKMREISANCWVDWVFADMDSFGPGNNIVISDCRYRNELEAAKAKGFIPVLVTAPEETRRFRLIMRDGDLDENTFGHISEHDLDDVPFDYVIDNSRSKKYLYPQIDELLNKLTEAQR